MVVEISTVNAKFEVHQAKNLIRVVLDDIAGKIAKTVTRGSAQGSKSQQIQALVEEGMQALLNQEILSEDQDIIYNKIQKAIGEISRGKTRNNINLVFEILDLAQYPNPYLRFILGVPSIITSLYSSHHKYFVLKPLLKEIDDEIQARFPELKNEDTSLGYREVLAEIFETIADSIPGIGIVAGLLLSVVEISLTLKYRKALTETLVELYRDAHSIHKHTQSELSVLQQEI